MGKLKVTLPLLLSVFIFSLLILILILHAIGFRNSNSGQPENPSPSPNPNFNHYVEQTLETSFSSPSMSTKEPGQTGENGDPDSVPDRGISDPPSITITSCSVAMEILPSPRSQNQWIYPHGNATKVEVLCDFDVDGGGWTIIQKRSSGPREDFNRTWNEFVQTFGSLYGNFWLGLENIHALTKNEDQELRIELEDFEGEKRFAKYSNFSISNASDFYRLKISGFGGDAGNAMTDFGSNNGARFTTWDKDNNNRPFGNCAYEHGGSWWFGRGCGLSNLNGLYFDNGETVLFAKGIVWYHWKGSGYSLAKTEMKIRTKKLESQ